MATYQSIQSASGETDSLVITKPTGLAVGDVMVAGIWVSNDSSGTVSLATPSGWTQEELVNLSSNSQLAVFTKTADSADVAASDFTFTNGGTSATNHMIGHLLRINNVAFKDGETSGSGTGTRSTLTATGYTPTRGNTLFIFFSAFDTDVTAGTTTTYAMATNNPTWTERAEESFNDTTRDSVLGVATATRTESTATGTFTATYSASIDDTRAAIVVLSYAPVVNGSFTADTTKLNAYALTPIQSAELNAIATNPTDNIREYTGWQNETKPTTAWDNETI